MIGGFLALSAPLFTAIGEWMSVIIGGYILLMSLIILPTVQSIMIFTSDKKFKKLKEDEKMDVYSIYEKNKELRC